MLVCFTRLLNTGLDSETLAICVRLCEQVSDDLIKGVLPDCSLICLMI